MLSMFQLDQQAPSLSGSLLKNRVSLETLKGNHLKLLGECTQFLVLKL